MLSCLPSFALFRPLLSRLHYQFRHFRFLLTFYSSLFRPSSFLNLLCICLFIISICYPLAFFPSRIHILFRPFAILLSCPSPLERSLAIMLFYTLVCYFVLLYCFLLYTTHCFHFHLLSCFPIHFLATAH